MKNRTATTMKITNRRNSGTAAWRGDRGCDTTDPHESNNNRDKRDKGLELLNGLPWKVRIVWLIAVCMCLVLGFNMAVVVRNMFTGNNKKHRTISNTAGNNKKSRHHHHHHGYHSNHHNLTNTTDFGYGLRGRDKSITSVNTTIGQTTGGSASGTAAAAATKNAKRAKSSSSFFLPGLKRLHHHHHHKNHKQTKEPDPKHAHRPLGAGNTKNTNFPHRSAFLGHFKKIKKTE